MLDTVYDVLANDPEIVAFIEKEAELEAKIWSRWPAPTAPSTRSKSVAIVPGHGIYKRYDLWYCYACLVAWRRDSPGVCWSCGSREILPHPGTGQDYSPGPC